MTSVPIPCQTRSKDCFSSVSFIGFSFFYSSFHLVLHMLDWIQIRRKWRPFEQFNLFFFQAMYYNMGPMFRVCMTHSLPRFNFFIDSNKFFCKISRYTSPVLFPSIKTRFSTPHDEKQPQYFTFPPPHFTVGTVHFEPSSSFGVRHTITLPSDSHRLNLLSSVHNTLSQLFSIRSRRLPRLTLLTYCFFRVTRPFKPISCNRRCTVCSEMVISNSDSISIFTDDADFHRSTFTFRCTIRSRSYVFGLRR